MNGRANLARNVGVAALPTDDHLLRSWNAWLRDAVNMNWRPGEWHPHDLLFVGDPDNSLTGSRRCRHPLCGSPTEGPTYCGSCNIDYRASKLTETEFDQTFVPRRNRRFHARPERCVVPACRRDRIKGQLCHSHYSVWRSHVRRTYGHDARISRYAAEREAWATAQEPFPGLPLCAVRGCRSEESLPTHLCYAHRNLWAAYARESGRDSSEDLARWTETRVPFLLQNEFSLVPLEETTRLELLYALQKRDARGQVLRPTQVRKIVKLFTGIPSVALAVGATPGPSDTTCTATQSLIKEVKRDITRGLDAYRGIDETAKPVWDLRALDTPLPARTRTGFRVREGEIDFTPILQPWLREVAMHWARTTSPGSSSLRDRLLACSIAAQALATRRAGSDPAGLGFADMTAVVNEFRVSVRRDGKPRSNDSRARLLKLFTELLEFGRSEGVLDDLSPRFVLHTNEHRIKRDKVDEDNIGKAVPESVVAQLDKHLDLIGVGMTYGSMPTGCIRAMFRTVYVLLRDTGRRPNEIGALGLGCLEYDGGEYQLIWDNTKAGRLRRRLPLDSDTVSAVKEWTSVRERLDLPSRALPFLFPAITDNAATGHLTTGNIGAAIRTWADSIPEIHSEELGPDGTPLPFDRSLIYPYAFRHTFCQRYADAGMSQHVLQDLMDHKSADTTAAYYKVSIKMKREAINTIKSLTTDRFGNPAPMRSNTAYEMRSVAVAFGNCIEPTNVKAGGKACPIRFQCAGCGSYRPDPSYLPAVEEHIRALKADREVAAAAGAAEFVIRNLDDQITAFQGVRENQKEKLASMPDEIRHEVEEASKVLRKLRAGASGAVSLGMPAFGPPEVVA